MLFSKNHTLEIIASPTIYNFLYGHTNNSQQYNAATAIRGFQPSAAKFDCRVEVIDMLDLSHERTQVGRTKSL